MRIDFGARDTGHGRRTGGLSMSFQLIGANDAFPPTWQADDDGLLCLSARLYPEQIQKAYQRGIFPWYNEGEPVQWWSPDPRFVLFTDEIRISKSMQQIMRKGDYIFRMNTAFDEVIRQCSLIKRTRQSGTWIHEEMIEAYRSLQRIGFVESAEIYRGEELLGGLYGVRLKNVFCGESMFSREPNMSKLALIHLVQNLHSEGVSLVDCQIYSPHLESLGARKISRSAFEQYLL